MLSSAINTPPEAGPPLDPESGCIRVLIANHEEFARVFLKRAISRCNIHTQISEASNGLDAFEMLSNEDPDLLLLDLEMPVLSGLDLLELIRGDPAHADLQVIVLTGMSQERFVRQAISLGVADYILKPYQATIVEERLLAAVERDQQARREKSDPARSSKTRILVADHDANFCDTVQSVLSDKNEVRFARTVPELFTVTLKWAPHYIFLDPNLPGVKVDFALDKIKKLSRDHKLEVYLLSEGDTAPQRHPLTEGYVERTFVPEKLKERFQQIVGKVSVDDTRIWLEEFDPEIISAVRQVFGMMTGVEPKLLPNGAGAGQDLPVSLTISQNEQQFQLHLVLGASRAMAVDLCAMMAGIEEQEVDDDLITNTLGEVANVVAGRIKNSCEDHGLEMIMGLPEPTKIPLDYLPECFFFKQLYFQWQDCEPFSLGLAAQHTRPTA